jgi:hypothetical protein
METATRSHRFELAFGAGLIGLLTILMTVWATAVVRDHARRSRCAQNTARIVISQNLWATASPSRTAGRNGSQTPGCNCRGPPAARRPTGGTTSTTTGTPRRRRRARRTAIRMNADWSGWLVH